MEPRLNLSESPLAAKARLQGGGYQPGQFA